MNIYYQWVKGSKPWVNRQLNQSYVKAIKTVGFIEKGKLYPINEINEKASVVFLVGDWNQYQKSCFA